MNLINEEITHKVFGEGDIIEQDGSFITIDFNDDIKKFVYPDAFGKFITLKNRDTAESLEKVISKRKIEIIELEKKREEEKERQMLEQQRKEKMKNHKIHESSQIVFWLDEEEQEDVWSDWKVSTGTVQSGKGKGQPNRPARLSLNSAGLLTAREPDKQEEERRILGLYMIQKAFTEGLNEDGMVSAHDEFKVKLTNEEAEQMLFWNYYINKNYPHRMTWNSGKYRYFDNIWTAQILKDIMALKTDEAEKKAVANFLEYFCKMNLLNMDDIPEAAGALKR